MRVTRYFVDVDSVRRRVRLGGLLASIQSRVQPDSDSVERRDAAAVTMTTGDASVSNSGPFVSREKAMSFTTSTTTRRRGRRSVLRQGVVCECCVHRCGLTELEDYCGSTPNN